MKTDTIQPPEQRTVHEPASRTRQILAERFQKVRAGSKELCDPLTVEDYVVQSMPDVSPAKWHLAHTSWFFDTFVLEKGLPGYRGDPHYAYLFNSYYNAVGPMHCRAKRGFISRPTVQKTYQYREEIDDRMRCFFEQATERQWDELEPVIELGLHHEQQHQELLLMDIKHVLAQNPLYPVYHRAGIPNRHEVQPTRWHEKSAGIYEIGHQGDTFCFDNERPQHRVFLERFEIANRLVTNGEFLAFIEDGGYRRPELWLSLGWFTVNEQKWTAPLYWEKHESAWHHFTLSGLRRVNPAEPVCHVSYFEADAYARWADARLPTEAEWETSSTGLPIEGNFAEVGVFHPLPVGISEGSRLNQFFGDVWEWTASAYSPYPGYQPPNGALGEYNGKFMCNQYVLRGGSCATAKSHFRRTYRNFFSPEKRWPFTGIRLARNIS